MGRYFQYHIHPLTVAELSSQSYTAGFRESLPENDFSNLYRYGGFPDLYFNHSDQFSNLWQETRFKQLFHDDIRNLANLQEIYSLEMLAILIKEQAGQLLNYSSLAKKIGVTGQTISRWINILDRFYYCFTLKPWYKNVSRSLIKEPNVKPPKIEPIESSYSEIQKRKQKKEGKHIRETNEVEQNYILGGSFRSRLELLQENKTLLG